MGFDLGSKKKKKWRSEQSYWQDGKERFWDHAGELLSRVGGLGRGFHRWEIMVFSSFTGDLLEWIGSDIRDGCLSLVHDFWFVLDFVSSYWDISSSETTYQELLLSLREYVQTLSCNRFEEYQNDVTWEDRIQPPSRLNKFPRPWISFVSNSFCLILSGMLGWYMLVLLSWFEFVVIVYGGGDSWGWRCGLGGIISFWKQAEEDGWDEGLRWLWEGWMTCRIRGGSSGVSSVLARGSLSEYRVGHWTATTNYKCDFKEVSLSRYISCLDRILM